MGEICQYQTSFFSFRFAMDRAGMSEDPAAAMHPPCTKRMDQRRVQLLKATTVFKVLYSRGMYKVVSMTEFELARMNISQLHGIYLML